MIDTYSDNLRQTGDGYWVTDRLAQVSYPSDGNALCFEVEDSSFWFRHRNIVIQDAIRCFPPSGPIFDVGGGNGFVAAGLESAGFPTVVVEPGITGVRHARQRGLSHVIHATLEDAAFKPHSLPAAGLFDVLEHIQDDIGFLQRLHALLSPGGRLYMTVPAHRWLWSSADTFAEHQRRYTRSALRRTLDAAGFRIEFITYFFWLLPIPILLLRAIPWALRIGRKMTAARLQRQLGTRRSLGTRAMEALLNWETALVRKCRRIPFGASLLVVATTR